MPITINLKQLYTGDSDNIKLDKVNYNFDQLVANGGGPQGAVGPKGDTGPQGITGATGPRGFQGDIGPQGADGSTLDSYWKKIAGDNNQLSADTILPIHDNTMLYPPVVSIGFLSGVAGDPEYNNAQPILNGQSPYQWIINRKNHFTSNLRFTNNLISGNWVDFIMDGITNTFTSKFSTPDTGTFIWSASEHVFKSNVTGFSRLTINDNAITYNADVIYNQPVTINQQLIIDNASADTDKIAVASDITGQVIFKTALELGGLVPYGTIVSILPSVFNDQTNTRFITQETVDASLLPQLDEAIPIRVGGGVNDYEGWYLCNGKTWTDGTNIHIVPDLNSFTYSIEDNAGSTNLNSQGTAGESNPDPIIIGGADLELNATQQMQGTYVIQGTVTSTADLSVQSSGAGTTFKVKKLPQIIYLGTPDMYWTDAGTDQAPTGTTQFIFDDLYTGVPSVPNVSAFNTAMQGSSYTIDVDITAPSGYAWTSIPTFTPVQQGYNVTNTILGGQNTVLTVTLSVSSHPAPGATRFITYTSYGNLTQIPTFQLTLNRAGNPANTTVTPPTSYTITYDSISGYTFDIVCTANAGYYFGPNPPAAINSLSGGGTYTINTATYSNPLTIGHGTLTINVTITGVTIGTTSLTYGLTVPVFASAPKITYNPSGYTIDGPSMVGGSAASVAKTITVENNTGGDVYIWAGINQFYTGSGTTASISGGYDYNDNGQVINVPVYASTTNTYYYSTLSRLLGNGQSGIGTLYRAATTDSHHTVQLFWSSTPGGAKYAITP